MGAEPTQLMIEVRAWILDDDFGVVGSGPAAQEIAEEVSNAMMLARGESGDSPAHENQKKPR